MNILLLNDNPVVTKLVTLSAQKTSDNLDIVDELEDVAQKPYDLFVLDDAFYSEDVINVVKAKTSFSSSLYICSRDAKEVLGFTQTLKKPFLPTDLVEIFANVSKELESSVPAVEESIDEEIVEIEKEDELLEEVELEEELELNGLDDFELDDVSLDDSFAESVLDKDEVQEVQSLLEEVDIEFEYDIDKVAEKLSFTTVALTEFLEDFIAQALEFKGQLYGALDLDDYETVHSSAHQLKGVAANLSVTEAFNSLVIVDQLEDKDEIKAELDKFYLIIEKLNEFIHKASADTSSAMLDLEEVEDMEDFELELETEIDTPDDIAGIEEIKTQEEVEDMEDFELELETEVDTPDDVAGVEEETQEVEVEKEVEIEDMEDIELELETEVDTPDDVAGVEEEVSQSADLESQIESAVLALSKDDLASEVDADTIMDIEVDNLDGLDALSSEDIKIALGESEMEEIQIVDETEVDTDEIINEATSNVTKADGVEALKTLLTALSDKNVAASLKGMKININITLGDS